MRAFLSALLGLALCFGVAIADDKKPDDKKKADKGMPAKITKIDAKGNSLEVTMKGKDGKTTEKTFKLTETVRYMDSTGKVVAIDVFKNGDDVIVLEADGELKEVHHMKKNDKKKPTEKPNDK